MGFFFILPSLLKIRPRNTEHHSENIFMRCLFLQLPNINIKYTNLHFLKLINHGPVIMHF